MSPDEVGFLKAVAENPADETARLAYADWLDERGDDPRAAFARLSADFLRCVRGIAAARAAAPPEWLEVMDPLFGRLHVVPMSWQHEDGDTFVSGVRVLPGQVVSRGQVLVALDADRLSSEVTAEEPGVVVAVLVKPFDRVSVGAPLLTCLRLPIELPLPPAAPPVVPLKEFVAGLVRRRDELSGASVERIINEALRVHQAARMVFGSRVLRDAYLAAIVTHGASPRPTEPRQALNRLDALIAALRVLLARSGQPQGFNELPAAPDDGEPAAP